MTARKPTVGKMVFIGAGNMAAALVKGLIKSGVSFPADISVTDVRPERLVFFQKEFGVAASGGNAEAVRKADLVVLAVKPQTVDEVLGEIRASLNKEALVVSIAAGIRTERIEARLSEGQRVVRAMPNTPALVCSGAAAICGGRCATEKDLDIAETLLGAVGVVARVREEDLDAITAVSGSGPAYVFYLIESMLEAAKKLGLDEAVARTMVCATVEGAGKLARESGEGAAALRQRVTSKGGTTAAAVEVLNSRGVGSALVDAVIAAHKRSRELSNS